ncbi:tail fiber [Pseudomonas phage U1B]|nr:tail fiber [Pseudomonas phage T2P]QYV99378.1 tail fiber [Pseudomonas phage U1B]QYV99834.1 tail fiber [Pseudomonas phage U5]
MAKKVTLPKGQTGATGTTLGQAGNILDLSDIDDIFGDTPKAKKGSPVTEFFNGIKQGLFDSVKPQQALKAFMRSAAPDGFSRMFGVYEDTMSTIRDVKDSVERTSASDLLFLTREAQDLAVKLKDKVPASVFDRLNNRLESQIENYKYAEDSNRNYKEIRRRMEAERDEDELKSAIDQVTLVQRDLAIKAEQGEVKRFAIGQAERGIRDKVSADRFDWMAKAMGQTVDNLSKLASYNEQVNYSIQKKGLEIQFRSMLHLRKIAQQTEATMELLNNGFAALVRNTGIPDHKKSSMKDLVGFNAAQRVSNSFVDNAIQTLPNFLGNFGSAVTNNATRFANENIRNFADAARAGSMFGADAWENRYNIAGQFAGSYLGDWTRNSVIPVLGRMVRPGVERFSNNYLGGRHNQASYLLDNFPAWTQEYMNNYQNTYGARGILRDIMAPFVPQFTLQDRLKTGSYQTIGQDSGFNQLTQRTIVEAIPGYLSRLLQETRMIRTGRDDITREVFDLSTGSFMSVEDSAANTERRLVSRSTVRGVSGALTDVLEAFDPNKELSIDARKALTERLIRDANMNKRFDPEAYARAGGYDRSKVSGEAIKELTEYIKRQYNIGADGRMASTNENFARRQEISTLFLDVRNFSRDPIKEIERLTNAGKTDQLREMGIIITEQGIDRINYPRIWELMSSEVKYGGWGNDNPFDRYSNTPPSDDGGPGQLSPLGDQNNPHFIGPMYQSQTERKMRQAQEQVIRASKLAQEQANKGYDYAQQKVSLATDYVRDNVPNQFSELRRNINIPASMNFGDLRDQLYGQAGDMYSRAVNYSNQFNGYSDIVNQSIADLYTKANTFTPVIKGMDFLNGNLIDINTGKIVEKISDITGEIKNQAGITVVTAQEVATGLYNQRGDLLTKATDIASQLRDKAAQIAGDARERLTQGLDNVSDMAKDWYLPGREEAVILGRDLLAGEYIDTATNQIITNLKDAKGTIINRAGDVVVTAQELAKGLIRSDGFNLRRNVADASNWIQRNVLGGGSTTQKIFNAMGTVANKAKDFTLGLGRDILSNRDAYLPGMLKPVLQKVKLKAGEYYTAGGNLLKSFDEINGPVLDRDGNIVVDEEQIPELINSDGSKHTAAKSKGLFRTGLGNLARGYANMSMRYWKWLGKKSVDTAKGMAGLGYKLLGSPFKKRFSAFTGKVETQIDKKALDTTTDQLLAGIWEELRNQKPDANKPRRGSWQDLTSRVSDTLNGKNNGDVETTESKGLFGKLGDTLKNIFGKKKGDEEDEGLLEDLGLGGKKGGKWAAARQILGRGALAIGGGALSTAAAYASFGGTGASTNDKLAGAAIVTSNPIMWALKDFLIKPVLGWRGSQKYKDDLISYRMMQYGATTTDQMNKVTELEQLVSSVATRGGDASFDVRALNARDIIKIFGYGTDDGPAIMRLANWIDFRFKPIFEAWLKGLSKINRSDVDISEVDSKVPNELKGQLIRSVSFPYEGNTPYLVLNNPFGEEDLSIDVASIQKKEKELLAKYSSTEKTSVTPKATSSSFKESATNVINDTITTIKSKSTDITNWFRDSAIGKAVKAVSPVESIRKMVTTVVDTIIPKANASDSLTSLQALRVHAYGMQGLDLAAVNGLLSIESLVNDKMRVANGKATYTGDIEELIKWTGQAFGMVTTSDGPDRVKVVDWLYRRFLPVFKAFIVTARSVSTSITLSQIETLTATQRLQIANAIMGATDDEGVSIWKAPSIFNIVGDMDSVEDLAKISLDEIKKEAETEVAEAPGKSKSAQIAGKNDAASGRSFASRIIDNVKSTFNSATTKVTNWMENTSARVSQVIGRAQEGITDTYYTAKYKLGAGGELTPTGQTYGQLATGNGGVWENIPMPQSNKSRDAAQATFKAVSEMTGVPVELLNIFCGIESSFNYNAKAPTSSAAGWFQFIKSTWKGMLAKYGAKFGIPADDENGSLRFDPRINALMGAMFLRDNYEYLENALGRAPTDVDLYLAHFMGPAGARKFLTRDQNSIGAEIFPDQARANRSIFFKTDGSARTLGEIYQVMENKVAKFRTGGGKNANSQSLGKPKSTEELMNDAATAKQKDMATDKELIGGAADTSMTDSSNNKIGLGKIMSGMASPLRTNAPSMMLPGAPSSAADVSSGQQPVVDTGAATQATVRASQIEEQRKVVTSQDKAMLDIASEQLSVLKQFHADMLNYIKNKAANPSAQTGQEQANTIAPSQRPGRVVDNRPLPIRLR